MNSKWITNLNTGPNTIEILEKNIGRTLRDINCCNIFFNLSPRVMEIKIEINKWDPIKLKCLCTANEIINKIKRQQNGRT